GALRYAEVGGHDAGAVADPRRHLAQLVLRARNQRHPCTGRVEPARDGRPDPSPSTGDDRRATVQVDAAHVPFLTPRAVNLGLCTAHMAERSRSGEARDGSALLDRNARAAPQASSPDERGKPSMTRWTSMLAAGLGLAVLAGGAGGGGRPPPGGPAAAARGRGLIGAGGLAPAGRSIAPSARGGGA